MAAGKWEDFTLEYFTARLEYALGHFFVLAFSGKLIDSARKRNAGQRQYCELLEIGAALQYTQRRSDRPPQAGSNHCHDHVRRIDLKRWQWCMTAAPQMPLNDRAEM